MRSDNVLLLTLLWTLTALCRDEDDISVICQNVTGSVGNDVNLTCSVSLKHTDDCVGNYRFQQPERYKDVVICKEEFPYDCKQRDIFTCSFTPTTAITQQFKFFLQTTCGIKITEFTLNTKKPLKRETDQTGVSVICQNVTGSVGNDITLTCSVSLKRTLCCVENYRFLYPERFYDSVAICREEFLYDCKLRKTFTCSYSPTTAITGQFSFFLQTPHGRKRAEFTVDITEPLKRKTETKPEAPVQTVTADVIVITVCSLIFIIIFIIIIMIITVTCVKKMRNRNPRESQKKYDRAASEEQTTMTTNV